MKNYLKLSILFLLATTLMADGLFPDKINKQVNDWGDILSSTQERQIEQALRQFEDQTSNQIITSITLSSNDNESEIAKALRDYLEFNIELKER